MPCIPTSWTDKLPDWFAAAGTIGAVWVALWQIHKAGKESKSRTYFDQATNALRDAVSTFLDRTDANGRPLNDRRHWLNFARGVATAQKLAAKVETSELRDIWKETEHSWRNRVYDVLDPGFESLPTQYYGYDTADQLAKNFAQAPGERIPLSEPSLVFVYRWIKWPENQPDPVDREMRFSDSDIDEMELFGPRGLARYIRILRGGRPP